MPETAITSTAVSTTAREVKSTDITLFLDDAVHHFPEVVDGLPFETRWTYRNAEGEPVFFVVRYSDGNQKTIQKVIGGGRAACRGGAQLL